MTENNNRDFFVSLSLANLLFSASWRNLLYPAAFDYNIKYGANYIDYLSVILCVLLTAAAIFGVLRLLQCLPNKKGERLESLVVLLLLFTALNVARLQFIDITPDFVTDFVLPPIAVLIFGLTLTKWKEFIFNGSRVLTLILAPFVLVTFSQSILGIINYKSNIEIETPIAEQLTALKPADKNQIKTRVIWIIFDELDYRVPFELKPIELPAFEKLKSESLTATAAKSPADDTLEAIPSLLTGKIVEKAEPIGKKDLFLTFTDRTSAKLSETDDIFTDVKNLGGNTAVIGWYHPYCRLAGKPLSVCKWEGENFSKNQSVFEAMLGNVKDLSEHLPFVANQKLLMQAKGFAKSVHFEFKEDAAETEKTIKNYHQRLAEIKQITADKNIDLAFIHLPLPHAPVQFDRFTKTFTVKRQDYVNNLALCDSVLDEIRKNMESANLWNESTIIISSDHFWRINRWKEAHSTHKLALTDGDRQLTKEIEDQRIPFFLKLKNQQAPLIYEKPFNTVISRDLIFALLKGEISTVEELQNRIDVAQN